jgi:hypothetical protein
VDRGYLPLVAEPSDSVKFCLWTSVITFFSLVCVFGSQLCNSLGWMFSGVVLVMKKVFTLKKKMSLAPNMGRRFSRIIKFFHSHQFQYYTNLFD